MFKPTWILLMSGENMFQVTDELNKSQPNSQINAAIKLINIKGMAKNAHVKQATLEPFKHSLYIRTVSSQYLLSAFQNQLRLYVIQAEQHEGQEGTKCTKAKCFVHPIFSFYGFWYFGHFNGMIFFLLFPSFPSCLAKCKQRLHDIFITSSPKVTKNQRQKMG